MENYSFLLGAITVYLGLNYFGFDWFTKGGPDAPGPDTRSESDIAIGPRVFPTLDKGVENDQRLINNWDSARSSTGSLTPKQPNSQLQEDFDNVFPTPEDYKAI